MLYNDISHRLIENLPLEELEKYQAEYQLRRQTEKKEPYVFYLVPLHVFMNIGQEGS